MKDDSKESKKSSQREVSRVWYAVMKSLFLSGYGLSIKVKDTRMVFSQGTSVFTLIISKVIH